MALLEWERNPDELTRLGVCSVLGGLLSPKCVSELVEIKTISQIGVEVVAFFLFRPGVKLKAPPEFLS